MLLYRAWLWSLSGRTSERGDGRWVECLAYCDDQRLGESSLSYVEATTSFRGRWPSRWS